MESDASFSLFLNARCLTHAEVNRDQSNSNQLGEVFYWLISVRSLKKKSSIGSPKQKVASGALYQSKKKQKSHPRMQAQAWKPIPCQKEALACAFLSISNWSFGSEPLKDWAQLTSDKACPRALEIGRISHRARLVEGSTLSEKRLISGQGSESAQ